MVEINSVRHNIDLVIVGTQLSTLEKEVKKGEE